MSTAPLLTSAEADEARPLRVALVGTGVMGRRHARVLASRPDRFELAAVMDLNERAAAEVAEMYGVLATTREVDAISRADAVLIATPIGAHVQSVRCALACGRHVLVEKPVAASALAAKELVELAESTGARLFVGHSERFNPVVRAIARLVEPGSIRAIELRRVGARSQAHAAQGEGALVNLGVHDLDLAAYLTRSLLAPTTAVGELGPGGVEERAHVLARTISGATVHVFVDQRPPAPLRRRTIALTTPTHVWHGDLLAPSLVRTCRTSSAREAIPLDTEEPLLAQALAFAAAIALPGVASHEIATGLDGMRALQAAERARRHLGCPRGEGENLAFHARF